MHYQQLIVQVLRLVHECILRLMEAYLYLIPQLLTATISDVIMVRNQEGQQVA